MFCANCGDKTSKKYIYCMKCGEVLEFTTTPRVSTNSSRSEIVDLASEKPNQGGRLITIAAILAIGIGLFALASNL